jgi:signal transduction histidine kinase
MSSGRRVAFGHASKVAAITAVVFLVIYIAVAGILDLALFGRLASQSDQHLANALKLAGTHAANPAVSNAELGNQLQNPDEAPLFLWEVHAGSRVVPLMAAAPALPARPWQAASPSTVSLSAGQFRIEAAREPYGWLVAGQSVAGPDHVRAVLLVAEAAAAPFFLLAVYFSSLAIGIKATAPVERIRRRQLEFTADASHELRTPVSVIEAEAELALSTPRSAAGYRESLHQVIEESRRLRRIIEDMLWLARFDSQPPPPGEEFVDLALIADQCAARFRAVADTRSVRLVIRHDIAVLALVKAPPEWIDRLLGVLIDNACRYSPPGGTVTVRTGVTGPRVRVAVEDDGPGVPEHERERLFDRFHRATSEPGGAGLGLAIADAVVRSTGGIWHITNHPGGGARMQVSWHGWTQESTVPQREAADMRSTTPAGVATVARPRHLPSTRLRRRTGPTTIPIKDPGERTGSRRGGANNDTRSAAVISDVPVEAAIEVAGLLNPFGRSSTPRHIAIYLRKRDRIGLAATTLSAICTWPRVPARPIPRTRRPHNWTKRA